MSDQDTRYRSDRGGCAYPDDLQRVDHLLDWQPPAGWMDPRGYDLVGRDGEKIGSIKYLLVSPGTGQAYFAIVDTGNWFQHHLYAVPLDRLRLDSGEQKAFSSFTKNDFARAPEYHENDREFTSFGDYWQGIAARSGAEAAASTANTTATASPGAREIRVPVTDESADTRKEQHEAGAVVLHKEVDTETRHISEPVTHTRVVSETREVPAGTPYAADTGATTLREGETLRIPVVEEELVVEKQPHVTREVIVRTEPVTEQVERDVPLRHERVVVEEEGDIDVEETSHTP